MGKKKAEIPKKKTEGRKKFFKIKVDPLHKIEPVTDPLFFKRDSSPKSED